MVVDSIRACNFILNQLREVQVFHSEKKIEFFLKKRLSQFPISHRVSKYRPMLKNVISSFSHRVIIINIISNTNFITVCVFSIEKK